MSNTLPISIAMGSLPANIKVTPQQLADMIAARLSLVTSQTFSLFVSGSTEPSSNVGPWFKNGDELWVWSNTAGAYVPINIPQESLGYFIGFSAPDHTKIQFWIQTDSGGSPLALKTWFSGAWVDVYATEFASQLSSYSTTTAMNAAIAAAVGGATMPTYPGQAGLAGAPQVVAVDAAPHKIIFDAAVINPAPAPINLALSRYVAPAAGIYSASVLIQVDNSTGVAASMQAESVLYKNGAPTAYGAVDETPSPSGSRWYPKFAGVLIPLAQNDYLELWAMFQDGTNTGNVHVEQVYFNVVRVST